MKKVLLCFLILSLCACSSGVHEEVHSSSHHETEQTETEQREEDETNVSVIPSFTVAAHDLPGEWVGSYSEMPGEILHLSLTDETISIAEDHYESAYTIQVMADQDMICVIPDQAHPYFEKLILHGDAIDDYGILVLTGLRSADAEEVPSYEFVREEEQDRLPTGYQSHYCREVLMNQEAFDRKISYFMHREGLLPGDEYSIDLEPEGMIQVYEYVDYPIPVDGELLTGVKDFGADLWFAGIRPGKVRVHIENRKATEAPEEEEFVLQVAEDLSVTRIE